MKVAILILSDPNAGEEAIGRLCSALATAYEFKQKEVEVAVYFLGTGTRWAGVVKNLDHPVHSLFKAVSEKVVGVSRGCADVFGAIEMAIRNGFDLVFGNSVPGTSGVPSIAALMADGFTVLTF